MRQQVVLSLSRFWTEYEPRLQPLKLYGIHVEGLIHYAVHYAATQEYAKKSGDGTVERLGYHSLISHLTQDLIEVEPGLLMFGQFKDHILHQCVDIVGDIARDIVPHIVRVCGRFDHTIQIESFGHQEVRLSFQQD